MIQGLARKRAATIGVELALQLDQPDQKKRGGLNPSMKPLTVGAWCIPASDSGVLIAQGGDVFGYALYLLNGRPHFTVRERRQAFHVVGETMLQPGEQIHLAGMLDADGQMRLFLNGREMASAPGRFLTARPANGLDIGRDTGSPVGKYKEGPLAFTGDLSDIRIYWGALDAKSLKEWATHP
jgi:hypothetical protein